MADTTTTPTEPSTTPPTGKFVRNELNQGFLKEIANAGKVVLAAKVPANTGPLTDAELDPGTASLLAAALAAAETALGKLTGTRVGKKAITAPEKIARDALLAILSPIQTARR